jgi:Outer membrane lipoprotein carrier protein LolA-like
VRAGVILGATLALARVAGPLHALDGAPAANGAPAFAEVMGLFAARSRGHVAFTEIHEMAMLKQPVESSGELIYVAPDRLEKHTLQPKPETLILDHGVLSAQHGRHKYTVALSEAPQVVPFVESVRATLAGDTAALQRYFSVGFEGDVARWRLTLLPRDPAIAKSVKEIHMDGARDAIRTVEIRESDGDRSLLNIGPELPP